jgi:hypothetical protein
MTEGLMEIEINPVATGNLAANRKRDCLRQPPVAVVILAQIFC